jgi:circadian clock protein KaiC
MPQVNRRREVLQGARATVPRRPVEVLGGHRPNVNDDQREDTMSDTEPGSKPQTISTGIAGLDYILGGGLEPNNLYLVQGDPGSGKTTLALHFLLEGVRQGERVLYGLLSGTPRELRATARSHGWSLDGIEVVERPVSEEGLTTDAQNTMFHPAEVELGQTTTALVQAVERVKPTRVAIDTVSEFRHLTEHPIRYRRQLLALRQFFDARRSTVLFIDDRTTDQDLALQGVVRGIFSLERRSPEYGKLRRWLQIVKMRGQDIRTGFHDFTITRGGMSVFPRLTATDHRSTFKPEQVASDRGTATLVIGAAGTGKSSLAAQYIAGAARRGEKAACFVFDERLTTFIARSTRLGMGLEEHVKAGRVTLQQIDPAELSPGEFVHSVRRAVEQDGARLVVIDSLNGYLSAMPSEEFLNPQLHELLTYLGQQGVTTILILAQYGLVGSGLETPVDASYLADAIILLRYFEAGGAVRKAISVVKKRSGEHETTIRELGFHSDGLRVGEPLREFQGVLAGKPTYVGESGPLMRPGNDRQ